METTLGILNFDLYLGGQDNSPTRVMLHSGIEPQLRSALGSPWAVGVTMGSSQYTSDHSNPDDHSVFTFSTVFNTLHEIVNTLLYNRLRVR